MNHIKNKHLTVFPMKNKGQVVSFTKKNLLKNRYGNKLASELINNSSSILITNDKGLMQCIVEKRTEEMLDLLVTLDNNIKLTRENYLDRVDELIEFMEGLKNAFSGKLESK